LTHFYFVDVVAILPKLENFRDVMPAAFFHAVFLTIVFYLIIGMHVLGAIKHNFIDNHRDVIRRMLGWVYQGT
jgi:cytochrome b561